MIKILFDKIVRNIEKKTNLHFSSFARSGTWMFSSHFIGLLSALFTSYCFAHYLLPSEYGTYKYIISLSGILGAFTLTGMNTAVTRAVAAGNDGVYFPSIKYQLKWNIAIFVASIIPIAFFAVSGNKTIAYALAIVSISSIFLTAFNTYNAFLNGRKEFRTLAKYGVITTVAQALSILLAIFLFKNAISIICLSFATQSISAIIFHLIVKKNFGIMPSSDETNKTIRFGKILSMNNIFKLISDQMDKLIIYSFLGPVQLAVYSFAQALPDQIRGVFKIVSPVTLPHLSERESHVLPRTYWKYFRFLLISTVVAVLIYNLFVSIVFKLLFTPYLQSIPYSRVLSLSMVPIVLTMTISTFLNARGNSLAGTKLNTATAFIEILSVTLGGYFFGLWGIVIAKVVSATLAFGVSFVLINKHAKTTL